MTLSRLFVLWLASPKYRFVRWRYTMTIFEQLRWVTQIDSGEQGCTTTREAAASSAAQSRPASLIENTVTCYYAAFYTIWYPPILSKCHVECKWNKVRHDCPLCYFRQTQSESQGVFTEAEGCCIRIHEYSTYPRLHRYLKTAITRGVLFSSTHFYQQIGREKIHFSPLHWSYF